VIALCAVQVVDVLGVTVLVTALPTMLATLHAAPSMAGVVATSYAMSFGGLLMLGARLGDRWGHRRLLLAGLLGFAVASALAGAAPSLAVLVLARWLQGAAAAASVPAALRLINVVAVGEPARRLALALWSAAGAAAGASGLLAGGLVTSVAGWRAVFWLNLPLAVLLMAAVARTVPAGAATDRAPVDVLGSALLTASLAGLIVGAALVEQPPSRALGASLLGGGILLLGLFARAQRVVPNSLLPSAATREPRLRFGAGAAFVNTATTSSLVTLATLYLQTSRHLSPASAGVTLLPFSLCVVLGSAFAGRRLGRHDPAVGVVAGLGLIAAGNAAMLLLPVGQVVIPCCAGVAGIGIGLSSVASTTIGTDVSARIQGAAAGILNTCAQLGTAIGVSAAVLLAATTRHAHLPLRGYSLSWFAAALLAAIGAALALRRLRHPPRRSPATAPPAPAGLRSGSAAPGRAYPASPGCWPGDVRPSSR
jgi:MFS family permease